MTSGLETNPGHIGGRRVLSPLHHPCSPLYYIIEKTVKLEHFCQKFYYTFFFIILQKISVCFLCGGVGHVKRSCPNELCFNCYEPGHMSKVCTLDKAADKQNISCSKVPVDNQLLPRSQGFLIVERDVLLVIRLILCGSQGIVRLIQTKSQMSGRSCLNS